MALQQGTIVRVYPDKGFGFIRGANGDVFFHRSGFLGGSLEAVTPGQVVEYFEYETNRGLRAEDVRVR